jgi:hypothetical protein
MTPSPAASALLPGARCATHDRPATGVCGRCGDYLCGGCGSRVDERLYCRGCAERLITQHGPRAVHALVLGMLGVTGLFFLAPAALVLAGMELTAIRSGESPLGGRGMARAGLALGVCGVAMAASGAWLWLFMR